MHWSRPLGRLSGRISATITCHGKRSRGVVSAYGLALCLIIFFNHRYWDQSTLRGTEWNSHPMYLSDLYPKVPPDQIAPICILFTFENVKIVIRERTKRTSSVCQFPGRIKFKKIFYKVFKSHTFYKFWFRCVDVYNILW